MPSKRKYNAGHLAVTAEDALRGMWFRRPLRIAIVRPLLFLFCMLSAGQTIAQPAGNDCITKPHASWTVVEQWAWERICAGEIADLNLRDGRNLDPDIDTGWDEERLLSPGFLENVLLRAPWSPAVPRQGVRISGALFDDSIDLAGIRIEHELWLQGSRFTQTADFRGLETRSSVSLMHSHFLNVLSLRAARIRGSLFMRGGVFNGVNLRGAGIEGEVNLIGSRNSGRLDLNSTTINSHLILSRAVLRDVVLRTAKIEGQVNMIDARIAGLLDLDSTVIGSNLLMRDGHFGSKQLMKDGHFDCKPLWREGVEFKEILARTARVGGQMDLSRATVDGTFELDSSTIGSHLFLQNGRFRCLVLGYFSEVGGNLDMRGAELAGLDLTGTLVRGELRIGSPNFEPRWLNRSKLTLRNTDVRALQDTPGAWPDKLELDGFVYGELGGYGGVSSVSERGPGWYIDWLGRDDPFTPQPYEQLASVLQRLGHGEEAGGVLYAGRERARSLALFNGHYASWLGQTALKYTIGYGLGIRYFRSLYWVIGLVLLGMAVLRLTGQHRVGGEDGKSSMKLSFSYSLDMLLPIIRLRDRHYGIDLQGFARYYFYFHQLMGYVLASFLIAGLSGLAG